MFPTTTDPTTVEPRSPLCKRVNVEGRVALVAGAGLGLGIPCELFIAKAQSIPFLV